MVSSQVVWHMQYYITPFFRLFPQLAYVLMLTWIRTTLTTEQRSFQHNTRFADQTWLTKRLYPVHRLRVKLSNEEEFMDCNWHPAQRALIRSSSCAMLSCTACQFSYGAQQLLCHALTACQLSYDAQQLLHCLPV